jgi:hypothetical protein
VALIFGDDARGTLPEDAEVEIFELNPFLLPTQIRVLLRNDWSLVFLKVHVQTLWPCSAFSRVNSSIQPLESCGISRFHINHNTA